MATRTRVTVAGAIIAAVADMLLILLIGWHSDDGTSGRTVHEEGTGKQGVGWQAGAGRLAGRRTSPMACLRLPILWLTPVPAAGYATTTVPVSAATTTTAVPVSGTTTTTGPAVATTV
jgi:hypothetical protein